MELFAHRMEEVAKSWRWFIVVGVLLIIAGVLAINAAPIATLTIVTVLGALLLVGGLIQAIFSIRISQWQGFFALLLGGLLSMVVGYLFITRPGLSAITLTLLIAAYFLGSGLFRILTSVIHRFPHWGWTFANGIITLLLGALVFMEWPISGLWVIGLFIGIDFIFGGISCIASGVGLHRLYDMGRGIPSAP